MSRPKVNVFHHNKNQPSNNPAAQRAAQLNHGQQNVQHRVPVQQAPVAAKPVEEQDPNLTPIDLPSNFHPYEFTKLYVRPIKGIHQSKFTASARKKSLRILVETISSLIEGASAFDLTTQDFRWLLYYLRKTNYVRVPLMITAFCSDEQHLLDVQEGRKPGETLKNIGSLNQSMFTETALDVDTLKQLVAGDEYLSKTSLGFQTVGEAAEIIEMEADGEDDDEIDGKLWLAQLASFLGKKTVDGEPITLRKRMEVVENLGPDEIASLQKYVIWAADYGVSETIRMKCKECDAEILETFQISASMFL